MPLDLSVPLMCLALNIYHEARAEPLRGRLAVALTTLNRAYGRRDKICKVVFEDRQFSWTLLPQWAPIDEKAWRQSIRDAKTSLRIQDFTCGATHFYAPEAMKPKGKVPKWVNGKTFLGDFGSAHLFYKKGPKKCPEYI